MKATVFIGTSLDGFIARPDGSFDFSSGTGTESHGYDEFMATVDALVVARNTFETALAFDHWPYQKPVFVLRNRQLPPAPAGAVVERLSTQPLTRNIKLTHVGTRHYPSGRVQSEYLVAS